MDLYQSEYFPYLFVDNKNLIEMTLFQRNTYWLI